MSATEPDRPEAVGLPPRVFLYTLDQIAGMLGLSLEVVKLKYVFYQNRSTGVKSPHVMKATNIAPPDEPADWRILESEFIRWLRQKQIKVHAIYRLSV